jgi:ribosomal protein S18 acetylase RimI-like enzyme
MIRPAVFADVPALRRLFAALVAELEATRGPIVYPAHGPEDLDNFTLLAARRIGQEPSCLFYVAVDDDTGELVGYLGGEISERLLGEPRVFGSAHWLYILPTHRGRGYARALVRRGVADLEALGVTHVEIGALANDPQWMARGWVPYLVHHALPLAAILASVADRPAPTPAAPEAPAPPPTPRTPRKRRGRPPRPKLIAGGRA